MGIIGCSVKSHCFRFIEDIHTYGELLEEIEKNEEAIKEVINGFFYEEGDELDLVLRLNHLKKIKIKYEKQWRMEQELGIYECPECGSIKLTVMRSEDIAKFHMYFEAECIDCGNKWFNSVNRYEYRRIFDNVEEEFSHEVLLYV